MFAEWPLEPPVIHVNLVKVGVDVVHVDDVERESGVILSFCSAGAHPETVQTIETKFAFQPIRAKPSI